MQRSDHMACRRGQLLFGFDFFISYSRREASNYAIALEKALAQAGLKCFLGREDGVQSAAQRLARVDKLRAAPGLSFGAPNPAHREPGARLLRSLAAIARVNPWHWPPVFVCSPNGANRTDPFAANQTDPAHSLGPRPWPPHRGLIATKKCVWTHYPLFARC